MTTPLYRSDLAVIHHEGFGGLAHGAGPGLLRAFRAAGIRGGRVIDLGAGSGIWLQRLVRAGYEAIGVEPSPAMVRLARVQAPKARLVGASAYDFAWPPCDAVTALGEVLGYTTAPARHPTQLRQLFKRVHRALRPGGLFVFDLMVTGSPAMDYRTWRAGQHWAVLVKISEDRKRRVLKREITTFRAVGARFRRSHETHLVRLFTRAEVVTMLRAAGFVVRTSSRYGSARLGARRAAFWARKAR
jgi:SAM-dependent methyltransferase